MQTRQFQILNKLLSTLSKLLAILVLSILVVGSFNLFAQKSFADFNLNSMGTLSAACSNATITQKDYYWAASIVQPICLAFLGYILFKASYLFDHLAEGKTPFSNKFIRSVKIMGFILITYDLATSLLYTLFVNFSAEKGWFFYLSLTSFFFIGLILYLVSGILNYGINLQ